jgi:hypothetical protein
MRKGTVTRYQPLFRLIASDDSARLLPQLSLRPSPLFKPPLWTFRKPHTSIYNHHMVATRTRTDTPRSVHQPSGVATVLSPIWSSGPIIRTRSTRHPHTQSRCSTGTGIPHLFPRIAHLVVFFHLVCKISCSPRPYHRLRRHPLTCQWTNSFPVPSPFIRPVARSYTQMAIVLYVFVALLPLSAWVWVISGNLTEKKAKHFLVRCHLRMKAHVADDIHFVLNQADHAMAGHFVNTTDIV